MLGIICTNAEGIRKTIFLTTVIAKGICQDFLRQHICFVVFNRLIRRDRWSPTRMPHLILVSELIRWVTLIWVNDAITPWCFPLVVRASSYLRLSNSSCDPLLFLSILRVRIMASSPSRFPAGSPMSFLTPFVVRSFHVAPFRFSASSLLPFGLHSLKTLVAFRHPALFIIVRSCLTRDESRYTSGTKNFRDRRMTTSILHSMGVRARKPKQHSVRIFSRYTPEDEKYDEEYLLRPEYEFTAKLCDITTFLPYRHPHSQCVTNHHGDTSP